MTYFEKETIVCDHDDHGNDGLSFQVDKTWALISKAADKGFTCPDGHSRVWKNHVVEDARERIQELLNDDSSDEVQRLEKEVRQREREMESMRETFADYIADPGIVDVGPSGYIWKCSCGSVSKSAQSTETKARNLYESHLENVHDGEEPASFVCDCGAGFDSQSAFYGHKTHCEVFDDD